MGVCAKINNFKRHEAIEQLLAKYTARELAGLVVDIDLNKIKAEAVREYGIYLKRRELAKINPSPEDYANKLENQND